MENIRPGVSNIDLIQGEDYIETITLIDQLTGDPFDISTADKIVLEIKEDLRSKSVIKLTLGNGLTIIGTNELKLLIHNSLTLKLSRQKYLYDILFGLETSTNPQYLIKGQINVINSISRITP
ncbi:hypothetical protein [Cyclobacterium marinum]|uniref:Uncharacterized protein n=1 Tax=Cyclobacterium marinum (strain ATCC 25205 / DSM 745 / LMG 13164 / NCIMB 1802) TaxID=880070 RepID=G0J1Z2_CYCMS|nr:hypothetical protein [Cyclobacterium marinum]AEL23998.1 hypothetical protein Cycma_0216 [Cyclobacterium marinum DSM 745]